MRAWNLGGRALSLHCGPARLVRCSLAVAVSGVAVPATAAGPPRGCELLCPLEGWLPAPGAEEPLHREMNVDQGLPALC